MWDQHYSHARQGCRSRIIPTYVGSTGNVSFNFDIASNHSHVCGINDKIKGARKAILESFPRMWDQRTMSTSVDTSGRIIPTYVGSTKHERNTKFNRTNHSHVCGINSNCRPSNTRTSESFPRMWDQLPLASLTSGAQRIIPTYVGSTHL